MDWHSPHSPPFSAHADAVGDATTSSASVPENVNVNINPKSALASVDEDGLFLARPGASNASYSSTEDDSSNATNTGASSLNNDSDCETIATAGENCASCRDSSAVPSLCSSATSSFNSRKAKGRVAGTNEATAPDVDKLLIEELQELSVADRGMVQEEIHGVSTCAVSEDNEKISEGLKCLEEEIRAIRQEVLLSSDQVSRSGYTYDESIWAYLAVDEERSSASSLSPNSQKRLLYSYVFHPDFRLKFLRADLYDAKKAAHRYLRCVECLLKYYGSYALQRPLMYDDLGKECQDVFKAGYTQILPSRDRAGRLVVICQPRDKETSMFIVAKIFTYVFQVVSEDVETQRRGCIFIFSANDHAIQTISEPSAKKEYSIYREGSPIRRSCTHFCLPEDNPKMRMVRYFMMMHMRREERVRTRIHMEGKLFLIAYCIMTTCNIH